MKTKLILLIIAIMLLVWMHDVSCYEETNLLINSGFEKGSKSWNLWGLELPLPVAEQPHTGKRCLQARDVAGGYSAGAWQWFKAEPETYYLFEGWVKAESLDGECWIELQWFDETNSIQIDETITSKGSAIISKTVDWTKLQVEAYAPPGAKIGRIACKVEGTGGHAYFDDAKVVKKNKP